MKALANKVIVRRLPPEKNVGLLFLPENQAWLNPKCEVISVGKVCKGSTLLSRELTELFPGDYVYVRAYDGIQLDPINDPNLLIVDLNLIDFKYAT